MTFELTPPDPDAPRTDRRRSGREKGPKTKTISLAVPVFLFRPVAIGVLACAVGWGVGMRSGYSYAKQDAAAIMQLEGGATYSKPGWRQWADAPKSYEPPAQLGMLMSMIGGTIPGTGGMTSGDVWNGYQTRMRRDFFRDPKAQ
jgi:hypothetical protein